MILGDSGTVFETTEWNHRMTILNIVLLVFVVSPAVESQGASGAMSAQEIMQRTAERAELQYRTSQEANFTSESVMKNQKFDGSGEITETEVLLHRQYPVDGAVFEELVQKNGRPLNPKERENEEMRKREFVREVEERRMRGDYLQPEKERAIRFNQDFVDRYQYELVKTGSLRAHSCWIIDFKPREGKLPVRSTMDHALNQLTGRLWVSKEDFGLVRVEFAMRKPFKYWGGLIAVIRNTDGHVDYERPGPGVWVPLHFNLKLDIRIMLLKNIRQLITKDWYNYTLIASAAPASEIPEPAEKSMGESGPDRRISLDPQLPRFE